MQASAAARATLSRWYWAVPYLAVTVLALSMLAVVWLLQARAITSLYELPEDINTPDELGMWASFGSF